MSNHFPAVPADLGLASIFYSVSFPTPFGDSPLNFTGGENSFGPFTNSGSGPAFNFDTPGTFGTFDQDAIEAVIATSVTNCCQALSEMSGVALATVQADVRVTRNWVWRDTDGFLLNYQDAMTYPV